MSRMNLGSVLLAGFMLVAAVPHSEAQTTFQTNVSNFSYDPFARTLAAGDKIQFNWIEGTHTVTAYEGASFDSGSRGVGSSFMVTYEGGRVLYRCLLHSSISDLGECSSMCGILDDDEIDTIPPTPQVESPRSREIVVPTPRIGAGVENPVLISGSVSDNIAVSTVILRLFDTVGVQRVHTASCQGCGTPLATFEFEASLLPGSYVVEAQAIDSSGNTKKSTRVPFFVL